MRTLLIFVMSLFLIQPVANAQQSASRSEDISRSKTLTLVEAVRLAESSSSILLTKQAEITAAQGASTDARALLFNNPQLSLERTRRQVPQPDVPTERRNEWRAGISQVFEIAGQAGYRRDTSGAAQSALEVGLEEARLKVRSEAGEQFFRVLGLQQRIEIERQAGVLFESTASAVEKRRLAGEDTRLDANVALVEAERARNQLAVAEEQLLDARGELAIRLQLPPTDFVVAEGELAPSPLPYSRERLVEAAKSQPRLRGLALREESAVARLRLEHASVYPDVTVGLSVGREGPLDARERLTTLSVSVPLPLFKRNATGIGQASSELTQVRTQRLAAERESSVRISVLWSKLESLNGRARRLRDSVISPLQSNETLAAKSRSAGQIGLLELIVVNRQSLDARRDLIDALVEYQSTRLALELAAGWSSDGQKQ